MINVLTDSNYDSILQNDRIAVVKVFAPWCGPCKFMKSHYEKWSNKYSVFMDTPVSFYEIENDKNKGFIEKYKVESLPTLIFFVHGIEVFKIKGMTRASVFEDTLKKSLEIKYEINRG